MAKNQKIKIRVTLSIEVDPKEWHAVYGNGDQPAQVRDDVKSYVFTAVSESAGMDESEAQVTLLNP
jgi:hypothetical protein